MEHHGQRTTLLVILGVAILFLIAGTVYGLVSQNKNGGSSFSPKPATEEIDRPGEFMPLPREESECIGPGLPCEFPAFSKCVNGGWSCVTETE